MKEFPKKISVDNKSNFPDFLFNRNLAYLRREITENVLKGNEENYFDLEQFKTSFNLTIETITSMVETVRIELGDLGWNTKLSFGKTALFIYSTEEPPSNCYEDEF